VTPAGEPFDEWWADFEWGWQSYTEPHSKYWKARAREGTRLSREYAKRRVRAIHQSRAHRLDRCGTKMVFNCSCRELQVETMCRQWAICDTCRRRRAKVLRRKFMEALPLHDSAPGRWRFITLTAPHRGVHDGRVRIGEGWRKLRQLVHKRIGSFPYVLVWEVTRGRDGRGHVHAHVVAKWPRFDWTPLAAAWKRYVDDAKAPGPSIQTARHGYKAAASYCAKYATKGIQVLDFPPVLAAQVCASWYQRRTYTASRGFWLPRVPLCPHCGCGYQVANKPAADLRGWLEGELSSRGVWYSYPAQCRLRNPP